MSRFGVVEWEGMEWGGGGSGFRDITWFSEEGKDMSVTIREELEASGGGGHIFRRR